MDPTRRKVTKVAREAGKLVARELRGAGVGSSEIDLIHLARKRPGITQKEAAEELAMDAGALARRVSRLVQKGYLTREPNPADGRSRMLRATSKAEELKLSKARVEAEFYGYVLEQLPPGDAAEFARLLDEVYDAARAESLAGFPHVRARLADGEAPGPAGPTGKGGQAASHA